MSNETISLEEIKQFSEKVSKGFSMVQKREQVINLIEDAKKLAKAKLSNFGKKVYARPEGFISLELAQSILIDNNKKIIEQKEQIKKYKKEIQKLNRVLYGRTKRYKEEFIVANSNVRHAIDDQRLEFIHSIDSLKEKKFIRYNDDEIIYDITNYWGKITLEQFVDQKDFYKANLDPYKTRMITKDISKAYKVKRKS